MNIFPQNVLNVVSHVSPKLIFSEICTSVLKVKGIDVFVILSH